MFEQFFSRELAEQLAANPEILTGKDALVTMLAADIRGFSAISERLGAETSLQWIQDTLDALTAIVMQHGGVVVDYIGDAVLAMWGVAGRAARPGPPGLPGGPRNASRSRPA